MLYVHTQTKKRSGSTTHRYRPSNRQLAPISSTASAYAANLVLFYDYSNEYEDNTFGINELRSIGEIFL
jgi:hypothetical protein